MLHLFDKNGIKFQYPEAWTLIEEEWDSNISALTFEVGEAIYMIDIYHTGEGIELERYAKMHFEYFSKNLSIGSKVVAAPTLTKISEQGHSGLELEFVVRTWLFLKSIYVNPVFRVSSSNCISYISGQFPKVGKAASMAAFNLVLGSYSAN